MEHSKLSKDATDIGKLAQITHFTGNMVSVIKLDGSSATLTVPPYAQILYSHVD